jgi:hypothetical protein
LAPGRHHSDSPFKEDPILTQRKQKDHYFIIPDIHPQNQTTGDVINKKSMDIGFPRFSNANHTAWSRISSTDISQKMCFFTAKQL